MASLSVTNFLITFDAINFFPDLPTLSQFMAVHLQRNAFSGRRAPRGAPRRLQGLALGAQ